MSLAAPYRSDCARQGSGRDCIWDIFIQQHVIPWWHIRYDTR
jgi:hypothetical protein